MADSRNIVVNGVGPVLFERSKRAKRISIVVRPFRGVRVAVPHGCSFAKAREFVLSEAGWIKTHLDRVKRREELLKKNAAGHETIDRTEAQTILCKRLEYLAGKRGFAYRGLTVRNQKTRWGSCYGRNSISLNMQLIRLPEELMDYVILHELVHTKIKNHSPAFWAELNKLVGNGKQLRVRLRSYGMGLY